MTHLITGATGKIGSRVVERLLAQGRKPRVFVRDAEKARQRFGEAVEISVGDLADKTSLENALRGVESLFLVTSGETLASLDALAAGAARDAGAALIVKLSSYDARDQVGTGVWHAAGEQAILRSGVPFTFLRPTGFMDNALYWAPAIKTEQVVRSATGDGAIPFIHSDDIADAATRALTTRDYVGESLPISGPKALSYADMTAIIGRAIGKQLRYEAISDEEARRQQASWGTSQPMIDARLSIFRAIREGRLCEVTDGIARITGHSPLGFEHWAAEHANAFL